MKTLRLRKQIFLFALLLFFSSSFAGEPTWNRVNYTNTTIFVGEVLINDYNALYTVAPPTVEAGDYLGAFVDGECRMVSKIFEYNGTLYVSSLIHGGDMESMLSGGPPIPEDEIEFRLWHSSSDTETTILGTTFFNQEEHIGTSTDLFPIGAPNIDKSISTLIITGMTLSPSFSTAVTSYTVDGTSFPLESDYTIELNDSRASYSAVYASDVSNNTTTITVEAEDGSTQDYTITFNIEVALDLVALNNKIEEAQGFLTSAIPGDAVGEYPQSAITTLNQAIENAQLTKATATEQSTITSAVETLNQAILDFQAQQIPDVITGISIVESERNLLVTETFTPTIVFTPAGVTAQTITWSSANATIASVNPSNGLITAHSIGTGILITATYGAYSDQITINVTQDVVLVFTDLDILISKAQALIANATVGTAVGNYSQTSINNLNDTITFAQDIKDTVTVQSSIDYAIETLTSAIDHFENNIVPDIITMFEITSANRNMNIGESFTPIVVFSPEGVTPANITWTATSNPSFVSIQSGGEITALEAGTVEVSASITVGAAVLSDLITITILPDQINEITVESITVNTDGIIVIDLGTTVNTVSNGITNDLIVTINGTATVITSASIDPNNTNTIVLTTDDAIHAGDVVIVSYQNNGNVSTTSGDELATFTEVTSTNNMATTFESPIGLSVEITQTEKEILVDSDILIEKVLINNMSGQTVYSSEPQANRVTVNKSTFSFGVYILTVIAGETITAEKVILK